MSIPAGQLTTVVVFARGVPVADDYTDEQSLTWTAYSTTRAKVLYGTGQERREAAQEQSSQAATIMVRWTPTLASVGPKDRATFHGSIWDITSIAPVGLNDELHFTAVRAETVPQARPVEGAGSFDFSVAANSGLLALLLEDA